MDRPGGTPPPPGPPPPHPARRGQAPGGARLIWKVEYDADVIRKDFRRLDREGRRRVVSAIDRKLTRAPREYGAPLAAPLAGIWKMKVGEWRVLYEIEEKRIVVFVVAVGYRRAEEVYEIARRRRK